MKKTLGTFRCQATEEYDDVIEPLGNIGQITLQDFFGTIGRTS